MHARGSTLLPLALSLAACGGESAGAKEAGLRALQSGDFAVAAARLAEALAARSPADGDFVEVAVAHCQALAHVDQHEAKAAFLALEDRVTDKDYSIVVVELVDARAYATAIDVLEAGVARFSESPKMRQIMDGVVKKLEQASQRSGSPEALESYERLKAIPYAGGDGD